MLFRCLDTFKNQGKKKDTESQRTLISEISIEKGTHKHFQIFIPCSIYAYASFIFIWYKSVYGLGTT